MSKYNREKHLEVVLKQLISKHFTHEELWWNYTDGVDGGSLKELDKELWMQLYDLIPEVVNAK